ncbi:MAG: hypothetical protein COA53_02500 [Rhodobacteraceae bacterium]|nr:MAG: hypothetical protein COA53_02500 [Paracoccaceae bacterium]
MLRKMKKLIPLSLAVGISTIATAETVTLKSLDGATSLSGEFLNFDGQTYTIRTIVGDLTIDAFQVTCEGDVCPTAVSDPSNFSISGDSNAVGKLFADLLFKFGIDIGGDTVTSLNPNGPAEVQLSNELGEELANITLKSNGSVQGLRDIFSGEASLAVLTRPITKEENAIFQLAGLGDLTSPEQQTIFALDGLVIITSKSNPLRAIAEQDLAKIFSGKVTNWAQIGGPSADINLYARDGTSGTGAVFNTLVMDPAGAKIADTASILDTDADVAKAVAADPLGISVTSLSDVGNAKVLAIRGVCGIQVPATPFTIKTEEYPLTRRLYTYRTNQELPAQLTRFLDFIDTEPAQNAIANDGFVDLGVSFQSNDEQGLRYLSAVLPTDVEMTLGQLRDMTANLMASDRVSITYRFELGSAQLDARAQDDIQRLAQMLSTGDFDNKEVLLIGYTDSIGGGTSNQRLSKLRAEEVRAALISALPGGGIEGLPIRAMGFGEISPLACNESKSGRNINRRVEVWLRDNVTVSQ